MVEDHRERTRLQPALDDPACAVRKFGLDTMYRHRHEVQRCKKQQSEGRQSRQPQIRDRRAGARGEGDGSRVPHASPGAAGLSDTAVCRAPNFLVARRAARCPGAIQARLASVSAGARRATAMWHVRHACGARLQRLTHPPQAKVEDLAEPRRRRDRQRPLARHGLSQPPGRRQAKDAQESICCWGRQGWTCPSRGSESR